MKFSLVLTVLNEEKSIKRLLEALGKQSKRPSEIVFVDGGSKDRTLQIIKRHPSLRAKIRVLSKKGLNIAQGRNFGISQSAGDVIIHTDAGCVPHKNWLEKITEPFRKDSDIDIVSGFYKMTGSSPFQKCLAPYLGVNVKKANDNEFLPSARSIAFRKKIWEALKGFPEDLTKAGEDTRFNYLAKKKGARFYFQKSAMVNWELPKTPKAAIKKFYNYAKGDRETGIWWHPSQKLSTHNLKVIFVYLRYFIGLIIFFIAVKKTSFWPVFLIIILYLAWAIKKNYSSVKIWQAFFWLPLIQIMADFSVMAGFAAGGDTTKRIKE
jgi:glycosyltransferase involved in cell wall biosynthesis